MTANPGIKLPALQQKITELWKNATEEDKKQVVAKEKELKDEYDKEMEEFKKTSNYKKYAMIERRFLRPTFNAKAKVKVKAKAKAAPVGPPKPDNFPKKPPQALAIFLQEQKDAGGDVNVGTLHKKWVDLQAEGWG